MVEPFIAISCPLDLEDFLSVDIGSQLHSYHSIFALAQFRFFIEFKEYR